MSQQVYRPLSPPHPALTEAQIDIAVLKTQLAAMNAELALVKGTLDEVKTLILSARNAADTADIALFASDASDRAVLANKPVTTRATWTPTLSADSGTFTSIAVVSARYSVINSVCDFALTVQVTTKGTAAGALQFTLPVTPTAHGFSASGSNATAGWALSCVCPSGSSTVRCTRYDGADPLANATFYTMVGNYETNE